MNIRVFLTLLTTSIISACWPPFFDDTPSRASPIFVSELNVNGATYLARHVNPTFASPGCSEDGLYIGKLEGSRFFFSPPLDFTNSDQINELISAENQDISIIDQNYWTPFKYNFSRASGSVFTTITGTTLPYTNINSQYGDTKVPNTYTQLVNIIQAAHGPRPEFLLFGNYYLLATPNSIPVNATHIELWFSVSRGSERELTHRVALENLYSWSNFIKPYITNVEGNNICDASV